MAKAEGWTKGVGKFHKELEPRDRLRAPMSFGKTDQAKARKVASGMRGSVVSRQVGGGKLVDTENGGDHTGGGGLRRRFISG